MNGVGRALRIVTYLPKLDSLGGVEKHQLEMVRELAARGHRISLFYEQPGNLTDEFRSVCEGMHQGPSPLYSESPLRDLPRISLRVLAARGCHPDLVYTSNFSELAWAAGIKTLARVPIVCHPHESQPVRKVSLRVLGGFVDRFVVSSKFMCDAWSAQGLDPSRIEVIYNALPEAAYAPGSEQDRLDARRSLGLPEDGFVVLYMGRLIPEKGVDVLLDAWRRLGLTPEEARLLIVGLPATTDAYIDRLRADAPDGCQWLPMRPNVVDVLHASDLLVLPSTWDEPFGRVIVEAMASARPAVGSAVGGIPEILDGEFAQMLFPRGDSEALAERMRSLRHWRETDPTLGERCAAHVARHFGLEAATDHLEEVFAASLGARA